MTERFVYSLPDVKVQLEEGMQKRVEFKVPAAMGKTTDCLGQIGAALAGPVPKCPATKLKENCERGCTLGQWCPLIPRHS